MTEERFKELYDKLPKRWEDISLKTFYDLDKIKLSDEDELMAFNTIQLLTAAPEEELDSLTLEQYQQMQDRILFLFSTFPTTKESFEHIKLKKFDEVPTRQRLKLKKEAEVLTKDYITFAQVGLNPTIASKYYHLIVETFAYKPLTEDEKKGLTKNEVREKELKNSFTQDEIMEMPIGDVLSCFFLLLKHSHKSLKRTKNHLWMKWGLQTVKEKMKLLLNIKGRRKN